MKTADTLLLGRREVAALLTLDECIAAVEEAFKLQAEGKTLPPGILGIHARDGGFHIKAGILNPGRTYFVAKVNANFPQNMKRFGLPLIQGIIVVCDGENGRLLALMDSMEITIIRTGAATAVAAKYLARVDAKTATICGCGNQGRISLKALMKVRRLETVYAFDVDEAQARKFAAELAEELQVSVIAVDDLGKAIGQSSICITCTPSTQPFLRHADVAAGTFIAAVGADSEEKQELEPELLASSKLVVDLLERVEKVERPPPNQLGKGYETNIPNRLERRRVASARSPDS
ncbi:MAG TPA: ornithine cyclodeaminase family protein [Pyrinomonadaceae bacterium]|nr:ornithine cyclodeaminase family protein [Pyrinomonadaceae bacterium]